MNIQNYPRSYPDWKGHAAMNEPRRLDERALCFDPDPDYRRQVRERIETQPEEAR